MLENKMLEYVSKFNRKNSFFEKFFLRRVITQLLNDSITHLLNHSITQLFNHSITQELTYTQFMKSRSFSVRILSEIAAHCISNLVNCSNYPMNQFLRYSITQRHCPKDIAPKTRGSLRSRGSG